MPRRGRPGRRRDLNSRGTAAARRGRPQDHDRGDGKTHPNNDTLADVVETETTVLGNRATVYTSTLTVPRSSHAGFESVFVGVWHQRSMETRRLEQAIWEWVAFGRVGVLWKRCGITAVPTARAPRRDSQVLRGRHQEHSSGAALSASDAS